MWHTIPYTQVAGVVNETFPDPHTIRRPILRMAVRHGANRVFCRGLVDSGADYCIFPLSFALQLGLDPATRPADKIAGVGADDVPTFYWDVELEFPGVTTIPVYAGFSPGLDSWGYCLLCQTGFFDRFRVLFDHPDDKFQIDFP